MGRKPTPPPGALPGKKFAPLNGGIRLSRVQGANPHRRWRLFRVKGLRLSTVE